MSYSKYSSSYSSPYSSSSRSSGSYSSPYSKSSYESTATSSRSSGGGYGSDLYGSGAGRYGSDLYGSGAGRYGSDLTSSRSSRYSSKYGSSSYDSDYPSKYRSSDYSSSNYDSGYSRKYKDSDYSSKYKDSDYSSKYKDSDYSSKYKSSYDSDYSSKHRSGHDSDYSSSRKTDSDTDYSSKRRSAQDSDDVSIKTTRSHDTTTTKRHDNDVSSKQDSEIKTTRTRETHQQVEESDTNKSNSSRPAQTSDVSSITRQTENMSVNDSNRQPAESARYQDPGPGGMPQYTGYTNPDTQSHSFKALQNVIQSGQDPARYTQQAPWQSNPANHASTEPKKYTPSHTWRAVHSDNQGIATNPASAAKPYNPPPSRQPPPNSNRLPPPNSNRQPPLYHPPYRPSSSPASNRPAGGPKPFVPSEGSTKTGADGDVTVVKSTSAYSQAPQDPDKIPVCAQCSIEIRGPFVLALNKSWCPNHFLCAKCNSELVNMGFVELNGQIYCENDYEAFFAPKCAKCAQSIVGDTVNALEKTWHPACFVCTECSSPITSGAFHVENGKPYCMNDWKRLFQTKCSGCNFPVEPGDRWIEALDANWHSECFVCAVCGKQLEGQPFYPRDGKPYCKEHASAK